MSTDDIGADNHVEERATVASLTSKEIKKLAKPEFAANPDKFYPTDTLRKLGFTRATCSVCANNFWRATDTKTTCGDSQCEKRYSFIGTGSGVGRGRTEKLTYAGAWEGFKRSLTSTRIPATAIPRYPVVARWRDDVDYVAAGIFCFQPYCVTGELDPPANPLICPQFCLRFNDLDNIGLTGRHYSGFIMLGIQVFNKPNDRKFWASECVEFNYRWLTEELGIDPKEITFIEDVWAGGGNLGPSIEYFVGGLELGNMVFMQYKTFPDGRREPLQVQVIDVGIGLERVPWLINGSPTSYVDVFPTALEYMLKKINMTIDLDSDIWKAFGPLSCLLNVDETDDVASTWNFIGSQIGMDGAAVRKAVEPVKELYCILDHTRCILMAIYDGSLPSNIGGAANVRNILRRVFALLQKRGWWEQLKMEGFIELFECHKKDLEGIYGPFESYKSFTPIIELEYDRWKTTDVQQKDKLDKLVKKNKGVLSIKDWITAVQSYGIPVDTISALTNQEVPGNLYYAMAELAEKSARAVPMVLYSTAHLAPTDNLYYLNHLKYDFTATILEVIPNKVEGDSPNIVVLDRSAFYPTSGGQEHDSGLLNIDGVRYDVKDVVKVGPCVLHMLTKPLPVDDKRTLQSYVGTHVTGLVDQKRRDQLRTHHTATHIVYASCRRVLGPHVWQNGAKKTPLQAHLDITHFQSLTADQVQAIQTEANRIVQSSKPITKTFMPKDVAEKEFGFHLYQGGVVPGNELRVVSIADTDTEACCGTHADNTSEVGLIKIMRTARISDGIVRLYYVAGDHALTQLNRESSILTDLQRQYGVTQDEIITTVDRFFDGYKKFGTLVTKQSAAILDLTLKCLLLDPNAKSLLAETSESNPTLFIANMPNYVKPLKAQKKNAVFVAESFIYCLITDQSLDAKTLEEEVKSKAAPPADSGSEAVAQSKPMTVKTRTTLSVTTKNKAAAGGKKASTTEKVNDITEIIIFNYAASTKSIMDLFSSKGFQLQSESE